MASHLDDAEAGVGDEDRRCFVQPDGESKRLQTIGTGEIMAEVLSRRQRATLVLGAVLLAACMTLLIGSTTQARADTPQGFCGQVHLGPSGSCWGAKRWLDRAYGWGDEHGVCVGLAQYEGGPPVSGFTVCTPYQDTGVYTPYTTWEGQPTFFNWSPWIHNNSPYNNWVHGVAFIP
jgi:hypothetical protein